MYELPFEKNTIDTIYSSHSLEHLPIRQAKITLKNWHNILKTNGMLYLAIPDLEEIMSILVDPTIDDNLKEFWYMYTLFGYQADCSDLNNAFRLDIPVDQGQFHTCGFTKNTIKRNLVSYGFNIETIFNYDGYATPSIWVEARKVGKFEKDGTEKLIELKKKLKSIEQEFKQNEQIWKDLENRNKKLNIKIRTLSFSETSIYSNAIDAIGG